MQRRREMASGSSPRQTGTIPKVVKNNGNIPQEIVTPTRRDAHTAHINSSVDWLPVSEQNPRPTQNRVRKSTNVYVDRDNEFAEDDFVSQERGSKFVPVRPQPRSLVLRQREGMGEQGGEEGYSNMVGGGGSPHSGHTAVMIVNPTTPNANHNNHHTVNAMESANRNNMRCGSAGRDGVYSSNMVSVYPNSVSSSNNNAGGSKPTNLQSNRQTLESLTTLHNNEQHHNAMEQMFSRSDVVRAAGDSIVAACPDAARVEQRLGQIREYIRVTSSLVENMRNSEDELKKRLKSLKQCNAMLAAQVKDMDSEDDENGEEVEIKSEIEEIIERNEDENDNDLQELLDVLQNLKESEKKLESMVVYLDDRVRDANEKITIICSEESDQTMPSTTDEVTQYDVESVSATTGSEYTSLSEIRDDDLINNQQEGAMRPTSAQSSSVYSDNELYNGDNKMMDPSQLHLATALQGQQKFLKYHIDGREHYVDGQMSQGDYVGQQDASHSLPPSSKVYGLNQIGVATTLPHVAENNYNWNNQETTRKRSFTSSDRDSGFRGSQCRNKVSTCNGVTQDTPDMDAIRDLQMRRHHLENQVSKMLNLPSVSSSVDSIAGHRGWEGGGDTLPSHTASDTALRNKVATVNVMKAELERLKNMLKTVDSIQNNFGINSAPDEDNMYDNDCQVTHDNGHRNRNRISESSSLSNQLLLGRRDSSSSVKQTKDAQDGGQHMKNQNMSMAQISRLQNTIANSNKCKNVDESHNSITGEAMGTELFAIQQLTDELKQAAQGLNEERRRLNCMKNRENCTSSGSSIKSEDKKRTNSCTVTNNPPSRQLPPYPPYMGTAEKKQLALKVELEAKKKQLERLMSKEVDHRTNQQISMSDEMSSNKEMSASDVSSVINIEPSCSYQNSSMPNDKNYSSSEAEDEDVYLSSHNHVNINQSVDEPSQKSPSRCSSLGNIKNDPSIFDSTQSLDGSMIMQNAKHNKMQKAANKLSSGGGKQLNKDNVGTMYVSLELERGHDGYQRGGKTSAGGDEPSGSRVPQPLAECYLELPINNAQPKDPCDVSNISNASSMSSDGERDAIPPPMQELPTRQKHSSKSLRDDLRVDTTPGHNFTPQSESQVTMWWHNKANQLQQQLELTTNLYQSLLQDKRTNQATPATFNTSQTTLNQPIAPLLMPSVPTNIPQYPGNPYHPPTVAYHPYDMAGLFSPYQQMMVAQQNQVAAATWGSAQCVQHLLTQQREIFMLRSAISNLEEKLQCMNVGVPRAHSTPPNTNYSDSYPPHPHLIRTNSAQSNFQPPVYHPAHLPNDTSHIPHHNVLPYNFVRTRTPSKLMSNNVLGMDNQPLPANFSLHSQDPLSDQSGIMPLNNNMSGNQHFLNNTLNNSQPLQNNRGTNALINLPPNANGVQALSGQSMTLNNQVPPGNRANNYWDNFRSYSRQNLLSGHAKTNTSIGLSHSPHPLVERSHNTLHGGAMVGSGNVQVTNTPKRDVNLQGNVAPHPDNDTIQRRGRRNISVDNASFAAPPDVLNVNQNVEDEPSTSHPINVDIANDNRLHDVNINRSINPIPEIIQTHSNNLNVPKPYGAYKKKSSTKLPAKNTYNTENFVTTAVVHDRNESNIDNMTMNPNLASTSSGGVQEKSTTKLFDLLRENVYSEVTALISVNESRPHFLIQLFRDLQQISSDTLRQRTLQSIQDVVSHYLSNVDVEHLERSENELPHNDVHEMSTNENNINPQIDNEIIKFILTHHSDTCTPELLENFTHVILDMVGNVNNRLIICQRLNESFAIYIGCKIMDVSDDLTLTISNILNCRRSNISLSTNEISVDDGNRAEMSSSRSDDRQCVREIHDEAVGPLHLEDHDVLHNLEEMRDEASGISHSSHLNQDVTPQLLTPSDVKADLIESVINYNGDLAEADQSRHGSEVTVSSADNTLEAFLPDVVDTEEQTPTEAEAEWLGLDRVPTRLHTEGNPENQGDCNHH